MSDDPLADMDRAPKPYRGRLTTHARLPDAGVPREQVLADLELMADAERERRESGQVSGAVYEGEPDDIGLPQPARTHRTRRSTHSTSTCWPSAASSRRRSCR